MNQHLVFCAIVVALVRATTPSLAQEGSGAEEVPGTGYQVPESASEVPGTRYPVPTPASELPGPRSPVPGLPSQVPDTRYPIPTLPNLLAAAHEHFPRLREQALRDQIGALRLENLRQRFRPRFEIGGSAAYHSEVPQLSAALGAGPPRDQYTLHVDVEQRVWDAGRTASERELERAGMAVDRAGVDVDFHQWRERIEQVYFGVLGSDAEGRLQQLALEDLAEHHRLADARVRAGVGLSGDRAALAAEIEARRQRLDQLVADRRSGVAFLAALTGVELDPDAPLPVPEITVPSGTLLADLAGRAGDGHGVRRAELDQARGTQRLLQARYEASGLATKPLVLAFAQAGIGRPADQNFFERDLTPYVVAGVRLRWQPFDWGVAEREQQVRALEREVAGARLETFLVSLSASLAQLAERIEAADAVLVADQRILALRAQVTGQSAAQLRAGVITASAYLIDRNAEFRAALAHELHRLDLVRDVVALHSTLGVPLDEILSLDP